MSALPIVLAIGGTAIGDEVTLNTEGEVAEKGKWDWQVNPQAYRPDDLADYGGDYSASSQLHAMSETVRRNELDIASAERPPLVQPR
jgi:hypothetical protein